jgi:hypothetical protein
MSIKESPMVDPKRLGSNRFSRVAEQFMLRVQCALGIGLAVAFSVALAPDLVGGHGLSWKLFSTAILLGLVISLALNPLVRYVRMLWRDDRDD